MSNLTIFEEQSSLPTVKRESKLASKMSGGSGGIRRIATSLNGNFKRIVGGEQIGKSIPHKINVVIVDQLPKVSRTFYAGDYDPDAKPTLPDCWSNLGDKPEAGAANPQAASCISCDQNVMGSGKNGKGRACRYSRRIAVLAEGDPSGEVYQMNIPAKSLFGKGTGNTHPYESYQNYLRSNSEGLDTVITQVAFDTEADSMVLNFKAIRHLTQGEVDMVDAAQADPETQRYIQLTTDSNRASSISVPALAAPRAAVFDAPEEEDEAEETKPVKRTTKKEQTPAPKKGIADIVSAWGGEED